jgi:hypothetical protein
VLAPFVFNDEFFVADRVHLTIDAGGQYLTFVGEGVRALLFRSPAAKQVATISIESGSNSLSEIDEVDPYGATDLDRLA